MPGRPYSPRRGSRPYGERKKDPRFSAGPRGERPPGRFFQKKICRFCSDPGGLIDYKDTEKLSRFLTEKGKILPRRITGNCAKHQRMTGRALKRARHAALLAFQLE